MRTLDLHDYNLEDAYQESQEFIAEAYKDHIKKIEIITGKSGPIRKSFHFGQKVIIKFNTLNLVGMGEVLLLRFRESFRLKPLNLFNYS
jgi:hypothetical protein